jgi:signal transduction histidine kinase
MLVVAFVLSIVVVSLAVFLIRNPLATRQERLRLETLAKLVVRSAGAPNPGARGLQNLVERAGQNFDVRVVILNRQGEVLADSQASTRPGVPDLSRALQVKDPIQSGQFRDSTGQLWLYQFQPLGGGEVLLLAAPRPRTQLLSIFRDEVMGPFLRTGLVALVLALVLSFWIARWVSSPLRQLAAGARDVSKGAYHPVSIEGPDEVKELGGAFNEMVSRVQSSQESQRDFVANVSHELKTPLTSIQGFAQAIIDGTVDSTQDVLQAAEIIHGEAGRMYSMVQDLLDLARLDSGAQILRYEPVDIANLLKEMLEKFQPAARQAQIHLSAEIGNLPKLAGDQDRLSQVFSNLLDNALKYSPPGGDVSLRAKQEEGRIDISVADSGPGIPPEEADRIFERFYQVDKARPGGRRRGVGLGLAIAREIVEAHQGKISIENQPGKGSVFVVKLPLVHQDEIKPAGR